jgi:hypothetical protein
MPEYCSPVRREAQFSNKKKLQRKIKWSSGKKFYKKNNYLVQILREEIPDDLVLKVEK